jgi:signal transduction histidine kinase
MWRGSISEMNGLRESLSGHDPRRRSAADGLTQRWLGSIGLAVGVGIAYFLAAQLSLGLLTQPDGVAVFWPAAGVSSGVLIALGRGARWPVATGTIAATIVANLMGDRNVVASVAFALCNAGEALLTAGLIAHYFGSDFSLGRLRHVLGLVAAAIIGTAVSGVGGTFAYWLFHSPEAPFLTTWQHWFASDAVGIVTVAPLVIGLAAALRQPLPRRELVEGTAALVALAVMTGIIIWLPQSLWEAVVPVTWLFPILMWLAARCRPIFAAAGAFLVSLAVVWTIIFAIGHFGDPSFPIDDRILQAQAVILVVAVCALVLAALFAERRESEARLARSNAMLERERDSKLISAQAITAAIAHEVKQPLAAIAANAGAALRFLGKAPPDHDEVRAALNRIKSDGHRTSEVFDGIRTLFGKVDQGRQPIDVNEIIHEVLWSLHGELNHHGVAIRRELASELPLVDGHRSQLRQVIFNLVHNALDAMAAVTDRSRVLRVRTELRGRDAIVVSVQDSGPGIDPNQLDGIFGAFVTTKTHGTGLGLAICRMIIDHHGGQLSASSDGKSGALFQFVLPIESTDNTAARSQ